jgi:hypothetical protein
MAGDGSYRRRGVVNRLAAKVQKELGLLALPFEQCLMDHLGMA